MFVFNAFRFLCFVYFDVLSMPCIEYAMPAHSVSRYLDDAYARLRTVHVFHETTCMACYRELEILLAVF